MLKRLVLLSFLGLTSISTTASTAENSYQKALDDMKAMSSAKKSKSSITEADREIMKQATKNLKKLMPKPGLKVGEKAPNFKLKNAFGHTVQLSDELKKGPVVLIFYRGAWCPYCNLHLNVLQRNMDKFNKYGARLLAISPQTPDRSAEQVKKDGFAFEVLSDLDSQVMKDYELYFELEPDLLKVYEKFDLNLENYNGVGRNVLPVPGAFIIDQKGIVRAAKAQVDYKERMEPAEIIQALKAI